MSSMLVFRWIIAALSVALAAVLIVHGNVVIGVLIGALAITRIAMFARISRRREQFRQRRQSRGARFP